MRWRMACSLRRLYSPCAICAILDAYTVQMRVKDPVGERGGFQGTRDSEQG